MDRQRQPPPSKDGCPLAINGSASRADHLLLSPLSKLSAHSNMERIAGQRRGAHTPLCLIPPRFPGFRTQMQ